MARWDFAVVVPFGTAMAFGSRSCMNTWQNLHTGSATSRRHAKSQTGNPTSGCQRSSIGHLRTVFSFRFNSIRV
eukprot:scaffold153040_cov19-Prasinocladus_malaysianus.AAC.1